MIWVRAQFQLLWKIGKCSVSSHVRPPPSHGLRVGTAESGRSRVLGSILIKGGYGYSISEREGA